VGQQETQAAQNTARLFYGPPSEARFDEAAHKKAGAAFVARLGSFGSSSNHAQVRAGQGPPRNPSGATLLNPNILFISLLGFFVATNVATFLMGQWLCSQVTGT